MLGNNIIKKNEWDKQQPLVSIVIPTYNRANRVMQTLDSIFAQTYSYFEVIVVDDGSTDNTIQVLEEYKQQTPRKEIAFTIVRQANAGAPVARNKGLSMAKGEYIVFFDSDDLMLPNRIEEQISLMLEENTDCCACGYITSSKQEQYIPHIIDNRGVLYSYVRGNLQGSTQSWVFKKTLVISVGGYDEQLVCRQDCDLVFRIIARNPKLSIVKKALSVFIDHNENERIMKKMANNLTAYESINRYRYKILDYCIQHKEWNLLFVAVRTHICDILLIYPSITYCMLWKEVMLFINKITTRSIVTNLYLKILALASLHYHYFKHK
jgi:glycosyltransferase involved in cell wall biosynthesis